MPRRSLASQISTAKPSAVLVKPPPSVDIVLNPISGRSVLGPHYSLRGIIIVRVSRVCLRKIARGALLNNGASNMEHRLPCLQEDEEEGTQSPSMLSNPSESF
jgi:hypothetical protein